MTSDMIKKRVLSYSGAILAFLFSTAAVADPLIVWSTKQLDPGERTLAKYYVTGLIDLATPAVQVESERMVLDCAQMPAQRCQDFKTMTRSSLLAMDLLEDYWLQHYAETRAERDDVHIIPERYDAFVAMSHYQGWPKTVISESRVKRAKRVIYRGKMGDRRVSVSETYSDKSTIREVEVAVSNRVEPRSYQFYVYDPKGGLVEESEFPAGMESAPSICMDCHINLKTGLVDRMLPNVGLEK